VQPTPPASTSHETLKEPRRRLSLWHWLKWV